MKNPTPDIEVLKQTREHIAAVQKVAALTGAGISAESGVPTFRGAGGLWKNYRSQDLATPQAFQKDPQLVWEFYNWRRELMATKKPNAGHLALAELEQKRNFTLITQNVDGLHALAGSRNMLELHGNIWRVRCQACGLSEINRRTPLPYPPRCSSCQGLLRPGVVWFGEALDPDILEQAFKAAFECQVMLVVGTSAVVQPAASLAWQAKQAGACLIEINLEQTPLSPEADAVLLGPSGEILPQLLDGL